MTLERFLAWEDAQEARYEFDGLRAVALPGVTEAHALIQTNLIGEIGSRLRGKPCRMYASSLKVRVFDRIRYPDAMIVCTPAQRDRKVVSDPVILFEVMSESSEHTDMVEKNADYRAIPSVQHDVVLRQDRAAATVLARGADESWLQQPFAGADAILPLPEIDISVPLAEFYAGLDLP